MHIKQIALHSLLACLGFAAGLATAASPHQHTGRDTVFSGRAPSVDELVQALAPQQRRNTARTRTRSLNLSHLSAQDLEMPLHPTQQARPSRPQARQYAQYAEPNGPIGLDIPPAPAEVNLSKASLDMIEFEFGSDRIKPQAWVVLQRVAQAIQSPELDGQMFAIEGHTDAKGSDEFNMVLSKRRAYAVRTALVQHFKLDASRLYTLGKGESELINPQQPFSAENRRVVLVAF